MFKNYILTALRNILRSKLYTVINVFCLSVGITGAILIALLLNHEYSYDKYHLDHENIYRIEGKYTLGGSTDHFAITALPLAPALKEEFSEVKNYVRFHETPNFSIRIKRDDFVDNNFFYTDSTVFDVFSYEFVSGQPEGSLSQPNSVVLTSSASTKFFGNTQSIGEIIRINNENYTVTAIIEDVPMNSHLLFDGLISLSTYENAYTIDPDLFWSISGNYTYLQLHDDVPIERILENMEDFNRKYIEPSGSLLSATASFTATPLADIRFTDLQMSPPVASKTSLMILLIVAVFLIVIAAVNYTNLATARTTLRAKEIGVRKSAGATTSQILWQFLLESLLMAFLALFLSLLLLEFVLPGFNTLTDKAFTIFDVLRPYVLVQLILITAFTGLLAGAYPSFILSRINPALILKPVQHKTRGAALLRKILVVFQFAISVILISGTLTVNNQLNFLKNKDKGISLDNRIAMVLPGNESENEKIKRIQNRIAENPNILSTSKSSSIPGAGFNTVAVQAEADAGKYDAKITTNIVDEKFLALFDIDLIEGRNFHEDTPSDYGTTAIINESAAKYFGWHDDALGKTIKWQFDQNGIPQTHLRVIGVMKDHNFLNLNNPVTPLMFRLPSQEDRYNYLNIHHKEGKSQEVIQYLEHILRREEPDMVPNILVIERGYSESFTYEEKLGTIFGIFAVVCILVSFLGLFGLSSFMAEQRRREVGIRKVLGSSGAGILGLFYKEFAILIFTAIILAAPVSWFLLDNWLDSFIYRTDMSLKPLLLASLSAIFIAMVTVSFHTLKTARMNPVDTLRAE